ncbi:unnamed protein product [Cyclocybe aegerita]|uniref:HTH La-type RNA-binding domain-containing protein n=1 Tax=Cyclocybe aegerita TaxID=1973307 RepID=A0A8S0WQV2_CYCAE|nr:unnamed protein product [Cyclocybe aegerita]
MYNRDDYVFFWKPHEIQYRSPFTVTVTIDEGGEPEEVTFPTAEHWMMFQKALLFKDAEIAREIIGVKGIGSTDMAHVKSLGRRVSGFIEDFVMVAPAVAKPPPLSYAERAKKAQNIKSPISAPPPPQRVSNPTPNPVAPANVPSTSAVLNTTSSPLISASRNADDTPNSSSILTTRSSSPVPQAGANSAAVPSLISSSDLAVKALNIVTANASSPSKNVWQVRREQMAALVQKPATSASSQPVSTAVNGAKSGKSSRGSPVDDDPFVVRMPERLARPAPQEDWPEVGKSISTSTSTERSVNGTPKKSGEKPKWVPIPAEEMQAAADAASKRRKNSLHPSQGGTPPRTRTHSGRTSASHSATHSRVQSRSGSLQSSPRVPRGRRLPPADEPASSINSAPEPEQQPTTPNHPTPPPQPQYQPYQPAHQPPHQPPLHPSAPVFYPQNGTSPHPPPPSMYPPPNSHYSPYPVYGPGAYDYAPPGPSFAPPYVPWHGHSPSLSGQHSPVYPPLPMQGYVGPSVNGGPPPSINESSSLPDVVVNNPSAETNTNTVREKMVFGSINAPSPAPLDPNSQKEEDVVEKAFATFAIGVDKKEPIPARLRSKTRDGASRLNEKAEEELPRPTERKWKFGTTNSTPPVNGQIPLPPENQLQQAVTVPAVPAAQAPYVLEPVGSTSFIVSQPSPLQAPIPVPLSGQPPLSLQHSQHAVATVDPDLEVKDFGFGFGDASGTGYATLMEKESRRARHLEQEQERERERERERQQILAASDDSADADSGKEVVEGSSGPNGVRGPDLREQRDHLGSGRGRRGFPGNARGGYDRGGRRGRGGMNGFTRGYGRGGYNNARGAGVGGPQRTPPFTVTPPPHFQPLPLDGGLPPPSMPHGAPGPGGYYPPPRQQLPGTIFLPPGFEGYPPPPQLPPHIAHQHGQQSPGLMPPPPPPMGGHPQAPPMPVPLSPISFPLDPTRFYLLGQLEYYLSPQNMAQDFFLRQQMDAMGWIPIQLFASFNRVRQLTTDAQLVRDVLTLSSMVQVHVNMVRMGGWESFVLPDAAPSTVEEQPYPYQQPGPYYVGEHPQQVPGHPQAEQNRHVLPPNGDVPMEASAPSDGGAKADSRQSMPAMNGHGHGAEYEHDQVAEEEDDDVEFVMGHTGGSWPPERPS